MVYYESMKDKFPFAARAVEWLVNNAYIELPPEDKERLLLGKQLLAEGHSSIVAFNHLALPDPIIIAALLNRQWGGAVQTIKFPASMKFFDKRMGIPGNMALALSRQSGIGMQPVIQKGDNLYTFEEQSRVNRATTKILINTLRQSGGVVPYAPEATRSRTGSMIVATASLADKMSESVHHTNVIFVQLVAMWGTEKLWGIDKKPNPFTRVHVRVSNPVGLLDLKEAALEYDFSGFDNMVINEETQRLRGPRPVGDMMMVGLARLLPEKYRGVYVPYVS